MKKTLIVGAIANVCAIAYTVPMYGEATRIKDVIVPEIFTAQVKQRMMEKSALIQSGAMIRDPKVDALLAGGGRTFNMPSFNPLDPDDEENISGDEEDDAFTGGNSNSRPGGISMAAEVAVRLSRNKSWSAVNLASRLAAADPLGAVVEFAADWWLARQQFAAIATLRGVFANNALADDAYHHQNDMILDVSGTAFVAGKTNFTAENFITAGISMGDAESELKLLFVHSFVLATMRKNNLIEYIPDSNGVNPLPYYLDKRVVVDDRMPHTADGLFESWILGNGALRYGIGDPEVPTETGRRPDAGNGGGQDVLYNRQEWCLHPTGHAFTGSTAAAGGPSNDNTAGNLAHEDSWQRVYRNRKQIPLVKLVTREF